MSQNSTARTGSECDGEIKDIRNTNARSGSSSCKSKRDIFGGPSGDSSFNKPPEALQDYLVVMIHNNDDTPGTSESSQMDFDLYNLRNTYTEQLNLVRRKLNLMALSEEDYQRCTITEITEDESNVPSEEKEVPKQSSPVSPRLVSSEITYAEARKPSTHELTTLHPFSLNYNFESGSSSHVFEPDYSPPKKKVCQRLKTPRFVSVSEGHVPYYTKVGIHESLFTKESKPDEQKQNTIQQFTETRETQCTEDEFSKINIGRFSKTKCTLVQGSERGKSRSNILTQDNEEQSSVADLNRFNEEKFSILNFSIETDTETDVEEEEVNSGVPFPNVIIENNKQLEEEGSSSSSQCSKKGTTASSSNKDVCVTTKKVDALSLNSIRGSSDDDTCTVMRVNTIIDSSKQKKRSRSFRRQKKVSSLGRMSMYEEINRLHSGKSDHKVEKGGDGDVLESGDTKKMDDKRMGDKRKLDNTIEQMNTEAFTMKVDAVKEGDTISTGKVTYNFHELNTYMTGLSKELKLGTFIRKQSQLQEDKKSKLNLYIQQYVDYKKEVEKAKTASGRKKPSVIGQKVVNIHNRLADSTDKLYHSETSLVSDEDKKSPKVIVTSIDSDGTGAVRKFWERLCICFCPLRNLND